MPSRSRGTLLGAMLFCAACGPEVLCRTPHGLELVGPLPAVDRREPGDVGFTCAAFERAESVALQAFHAEVTDPRFEHAEAALRGYQVSVLTGVDPSDRLIDGETSCQGRLAVGNTPFLQGSFAHELAHVVQHCEATAPLDPSDPAHSNWEAVGIINAMLFVQAVQARDYWNNPRCYASGHYIGPADGSPCATP